MKLFRWFRQKRTLSYTPLNLVEINGTTLLENLQYLQSLQPHAAILPVLKSNAYGHGIEQVVETLEKSNVPLLVVDSLPEAQKVYDRGSKDVLVLGEAALSSYKFFQGRRTQFCVYNRTTLEALLSFHRKPRVHLFLNTGMNREGIQDLRLFFRENKELLRRCDIVGICSHLASSEQVADLNQEQVERFVEAVDWLKKQGYEPPWVHLGNSAAAFWLKEVRLTAFRTGLAFYGYSPFDAQSPLHIKTRKLQPALRVTSRVVAVQQLKAGESVSYNETFTAKKPTTIAVIPFGYAEGLDRRLSGKGILWIRQGDKEIKARIAGRVCMNLTCVDAGNNRVAVGDMVEVVSPLPKEENSIGGFAKEEETIPYEVLVRLHPGIRRVIRSKEI